MNEHEVKKIANLAGLSLSENELKLYKDDFEKMTSLFNELKRVKVENVEPLYSVLEEDLHSRGDEEFKKENTKEDILQNAPKKNSGFFCIQKIL